MAHVERAHSTLLKKRENNYDHSPSPYNGGSDKALKQQPVPFNDQK